MNTPHSFRKHSITGLFLVLLVIILSCAFGCGTQRTGCENVYRTKKKFTAYLKNMKTKEVFILDNNGIVCSFIDNRS